MVEQALIQAQLAALALPAAAAPPALTTVGHRPRCDAS